MIRHLHSLASCTAQYLQVNSRDKQSEMRSSRSLGDLKGSLLKGGERVRKHSTGESSAARQCHSFSFLLNAAGGNVNGVGASSDGGKC